MKGKIFVISAPSGTGKTTILKKVMTDLPKLRFSISHTTRKPRAGEQDGVDYYFVNDTEFRKIRDAGGFFEHAHVHDKYYGTSKKAVLNITTQGDDVVLDIDVQGTAILRNDPEIEIVDIFIAPPNCAVLEQRLRKRATDGEETIRLRVQNAAQEMAEAHKYRYLLVNDMLETAIETVKAIIIAERSAQHRRANGKLISLDTVYKI